MERKLELVRSQIVLRQEGVGEKDLPVGANVVEARWTTGMQSQGPEEERIVGGSG